jgi:hypothetical protein
VKEHKKVHYRKTFRQIPIYLGKFLRMFIYQDDWKMLPMAALIAGLVSFVIKGTMMKTMEGTMKGSLALSCICIWNGFFNSIQVVCRERPIVKREHRSGMMIPSYILSHMVYQAGLCLLQAIVSVIVCKISGIEYPSGGIITPWFPVDLCITFFLITYASDIMSLLISCIARSTTAAMTIMPFVLIFELLFSGAVFTLEGDVSNFISNLTIAKWGMCAICAISRYNSLKMVTVWNMLKKFENVEYEGMTPLADVVASVESNPGGVEAFQMKMGELSPNTAYESTVQNVANCWLMLLLFVAAFAVLAMLFLRRIDRDRR